MSSSNDPQDKTTTGEPSRPQQPHESSIIRWRIYVDEQIQREHQRRQQPSIPQESLETANGLSKPSSVHFKAIMIVLVFVMGLVLLVTLAALLALYIINSMKP